MTVWKDIVGYEGLYQVSNEGEIRSLDRIVSYTDSLGRNYNRKVKGRIRKQGTVNGYRVVNLCTEGKMVGAYVHRTVAQAFLPNPDNKPQVNHKDEDKRNNHVDNLEWMTAEENHEYGTAIQRGLETRQNMMLAQYSLDGALINIWNGASEAAKVLGKSRKEIAAVARGYKAHAYGYTWAYITKSESKKYMSKRKSIEGKARQMRLL
jgi:NUMOD4 motif/HNH endonuclease